VDSRVFSTTASNRGMGNYVRGLIQELKNQEFELSFIGYKISKKELEKEINLFSIDESSFIGLDIDPNTISQSYYASSITNTIESAIWKLRGDVYLDATPFISPARIDIRTVPVISVLYDLIPLMMSESYLVSGDIQEQYMLSLRSVKNADLVIAISKHVCTLGTDWLGIDKEKIKVIYPSIPLLDSNKEEKQFDLKNYGLLMGGAHPSKNPNQIYEFCKKVAPHILSDELVILFPNKGDKARFESEYGVVSPKITVLESLSELEKNWLIENCKVFLNFSLIEGFGIPVQEAIQLSVPIIAIKTDLNQEMNLENELVEEPALVDQFVARFLVRLKMPRVFTRVRETVTTDRMYKNAFQSILQLASNESQWREVVNLVSPLSPIPCGISQLSTEILQFLDSQNIPTASYIDDQPLPTLVNAKNLRFYSASSYSLHMPETPSWFQLGGATWFTEVFRAIQVKNPGMKYAFVHDLNISGGLFDICRLGNLKDFWDHILSVEKQEAGNSIFLRNRMSFDAPLLVWLKEYFDQVFVHLPQAAWPAGLDTEIWRYIPQGRQNSPSHRALFNSVSQDLPVFSQFNIGVFGSILSNKRIETIVESLKYLDDGVTLLIVGRTPDLDYLEQLRNLISALSLTSRVHIIGDPSEERFYGLMSRIDILVSLRDNKIGQISGPLLQAFSMGIPVLIETSTHWSELVIGAPFFLPENPTVTNVSGLLADLFDDRSKLRILSEWSSYKYNENSVSSMTLEALHRTIVKWELN
jgi:glycosyltransferase involved in cell wall biosynthesis